ncbi:MAG TPA: hypothetical protein VKQ36_02670 [Ktedonobacterales bacterium]|nr:hypothetical protein [Ktedonobacterales bacterium]
MPMNRKLYPANWPDISRRIREREGNRCLWCGIANGTMRDGKRGPYRVVLTVAHLNHDPADCRDSNLAALCQRCHLSYDAAQHRSSAAATRQKIQQIAQGQMKFPMLKVCQSEDTPLTAIRARGLAHVYAFSVLDSAVMGALSDPTLRGLVHSEAERAQVLREVEELVINLRTAALHTLANEEKEEPPCQRMPHTRQ